MNSTSTTSPRTLKQSFGWILLTILSRSSASIFLKMAADSSEQGFGLNTVLNPWYFGAIACLAIQAGSWIMVLRSIPLTRAYPFISLVFVINIIAAQVLFHEEISGIQFLGILCIVGGIIVSGRPGYPRA